MSVRAPAHQRFQPPPDLDLAQHGLDGVDGAGADAGLGECVDLRVEVLGVRGDACISENLASTLTKTSQNSQGSVRGLCEHENGGFP